uniref:Uncharacterized protein n=1 Tax=Oryza nivara TaxID=4536 RepID=A0A0E0FR46_ORYNI
MHQDCTSQFYRHCSAAAVLMCSVPPLAIALCVGWPLRLVVVGGGSPAGRRRFPGRELSRPGSGRRADRGRRRREKEKKERKSDEELICGPKGIFDISRDFFLLLN